MQTVSSRTAGMVAVTRALSPSIGNCQLTYLDRSGISYQMAARQHREYVSVLEQLGLEVIVVPPEPSMPDAVFVEDTALVLDELAVLARPCFPRHDETTSIRPILERYRKVVEMDAGTRLEGGDVVRDGRHLYVGQSTRTNRRGLENLRCILAAYDYNVVPVEVSRCLHLSTAASYLGEGAVLLNPEWVDKSVFAGYRTIETRPDEPWAANVLSVGGSIIIPSAFPATCELLEQNGFSVKAVDVSELLKAEAGVTCMGLVFHAASKPAVVTPDRFRPTGTQEEREPAFQAGS